MWQFYLDRNDTLIDRVIDGIEFSKTTTYPFSVSGEYIYGARVNLSLFIEKLNLDFQGYTEELTIHFTVDGNTVSTQTQTHSPGWSRDNIRLSGFKDIKFATLDGEFSGFNYSIDITAKDCEVLMKNEKGEFVPFHVEGVYKLPENVINTIYKPMYTSIISAQNFSDEENPTITFSRSTVYKNEEVVGGIQAVISFDGTNDDIVRDIDYSDKSITSLTFNLTEEERNLLRANTQGNNSRQVLFRIKTLPKEGAISTGKIPPYYSDLTKTLTITGAYASATLEVEDVNAATLALTGDKDTIVKYFSNAAYTLNATATKGATIVSEYVTCGSKTSTTETGVIEGAESNEFSFGAVDSRNNGVAGTLTKKLIDYVKLTCQQKVEIDLAGAASTGAAAIVKVNGNYFNGSFGLANNSLTIQVRYYTSDRAAGEWITFSNVSISDNTYSAEYEVTGLDYAKAYVFQCRAIDKLDTVETTEFTTRVMPVFDWSGNDFNFNVPVNINAETMDMRGNTVIRHTGTNTVISGNSGNLYFRPGGTDDTSNETIFYGNGSIKLGGAVDFNGFTINGNALADYIIEIGEEAMGTNGTWYWCKWASGKAECWGCRNFGNMAVTTAWGGLYRSAILTQELPDNVFVTTPDVININIVNSNYGGWICKHENDAPSAVTTGSFIFVRPASATISPTYIGFHIIGLWKQ